MRRASIVLMAIAVVMLVLVLAASWGWSLRGSVAGQIGNAALGVLLGMAILGSFLGLLRWQMQRPRKR
jgi:uncharacterized protein (DUF697 family)